jgi:hypothetical protein
VLDARKDEAIELTFKGVAKNFKEAFAELVLGGSASLVMQKKRRKVRGGTSQHKDVRHGSLSRGGPSSLSTCLFFSRLSAAEDKQRAALETLVLLLLFCLCFFLIRWLVNCLIDACFWRPIHEGRIESLLSDQATCHLKSRCRSL